MPKLKLHDLVEAVASTIARQTDPQAPRLVQRPTARFLAPANGWRGWWASCPRCPWELSLPVGPGYGREAQGLVDAHVAECRANAE